MQAQGISYPDAIRLMSDQPMSESRGGSPIQVALVVLAIVGGGWYFFNNFQISGLDRIAVSPRDGGTSRDRYIRTGDETSVSSPSDIDPTLVSAWSSHDWSDATALRRPIDAERSNARADRSRSIATSRLESIRVASWSLDGFGPTKLANVDARRLICRVIREFDVIALQQITSPERDLVTRLVDALNEGNPRYDFVLSNPTGPVGREEQLAFVFDTTRLEVDRSQTYSVADPMNAMTYDPLVAWFRTAQPSHDAAWTFTLVNVRVELANAANEVGLITPMLVNVRQDGRGEDDVLMLGLFQADDAYLRRVLDGKPHQSIVSTGMTDVYSRYQTSNIIVDAANTTEHVGRSGVFDFLRIFNLSLPEAEAASSQLPVFAEFSPLEGGVR